MKSKSSSGPETTTYAFNPCDFDKCVNGKCVRDLTEGDETAYDCKCDFGYMGDFCDVTNGNIPILGGIVATFLIIMIIIITGVSIYYGRFRKQERLLKKKIAQSRAQDSNVPSKEQQSSAKEQSGVNPGPYPADSGYPSNIHGAQYPYATDRGPVPPVHHTAGYPPMHAQDPYGQPRAVIPGGVEPPPVLSTAINQPKWRTAATAATVHLAMRPHPVAVPVVTSHVVHRAQPGYIAQPWYLN